MPTVDELKAQGNTLFVQKKFTLAAAKYSEAIKLDDKNAILYSNRAACYLNLDQFMNASSDATKATELDPLYAKAWARLAAAFEGLSITNASIDAWKKAIETTPKGDPTATAQLEAYRGKLSAAEQFRDFTQNKAKSRLIYTKRGSQPPWVMAEKLLNSVHGGTLKLSSEFSQGADFITQLQLRTRPTGRDPPQTIGNTEAISFLVEGIMADERVFHITPEKNWHKRYNDQARFEVIALGIQKYWDHGPEKLIETAQQIQRQSGWDGARLLISELLRLWFMNGFMTNGLAGDAVAAHGFYKSIIEVLTWGRSAWKDVSYENKGNIFRPTFLWKIRALNLELYPTMISKYQLQGDPAHIKLLEEMYEEADDLIKELIASANDDIIGDPSGPRGARVLYISYYLNCKAQALSAQGYYHKHMVATEEDGDVARDHLHKAASKYKESAMTFVQDDERRPYFLGVALDCLWRSGEGTYRDTTIMMREFRVAYHDMLRIWLHSATPLVKEEQLNQVMRIEEEASSKLSAGEVTPDSIHYRKEGLTL